jgi:NAD+ diphosphatase
VTLILASRQNMYTGSPLDRAGHRREDEAWLAAARAGDETLFVPVWRARNLLRGLAEGRPEAVFLSGEAAAALRRADDTAAMSSAFLGLQGPLPVFALDLSAAEDPLPLLPCRVMTQRSSPMPAASCIGGRGTVSAASAAPPARRTAAAM